MNIGLKRKEEWDNSYSHNTTVIILGIGKDQKRKVTIYNTRGKIKIHRSVVNDKAFEIGQCVSE